MVETLLGTAGRLIAADLAGIAPADAAADERAVRLVAAGGRAVAVPRNVEEAALELILRGVAPPANWRPFIGTLGFPRGGFADLAPVAGLAAVRPCGSQDLR